jgi:hypothetical protein
MFAFIHDSICLPEPSCSVHNGARLVRVTVIHVKYTVLDLAKLKKGDSVCLKKNCVPKTC